MINDGNSPGAAGGTPDGPSKADPVDPSTGIFLMHKTDLYLPDVMPLALTRTYDSGDGLARPFGRGMTHPYAIFLWSALQYQEADLILPEGGRIHYVRTSPGTGFVDAVFEHTATPTAFYKSTLAWNGNGWNLTLLIDAARLSLDEYRQALERDSAQWDGGGFHFAFYVENRPAAPLPPALGEVRVFIGSRQYNAVTNATSSKPFAPLIIIRAADDFFSSARGAALSSRRPAVRPHTVASVLDVFIPGKAVPPGTGGQVELELAETHRPDARGRLRPLRPDEMSQTWTAFRFTFPATD